MTTGKFKGWGEEDKREEKVEEKTNLLRPFDAEIFHNTGT